MPLDTGAAAHPPIEAGQTAFARLRPIAISLAGEGSLGAALRRARETLGLEPGDIAQATRIRTAQLLALEADDFARLPPLPFVVGFVRAYALALGADCEGAVERLRREAPAAAPVLRAPAGLRHEDRPRPGRWLSLAGAVLVAAVIGWNLAQHAAVRARSAGRLARPELAVLVQPATLRPPVHLGAPLPPPPEATAPPTYATPGLDASAFGAAPQSSPAAAAAAAGQAATGAGQPFQAAGRIYGDADAAPLLLQARKPTTLVVRDARGAITFARQLAAGEAWRAPDVGDMTAEVGNPDSVERFVDGRSRGPLTTARNRLVDLRS